MVSLTSCLFTAGLRLPEEEMALGCTIGESVMLWEIFCRETLGPAISLGVCFKNYIYLNIATAQVHS